MQQGIQTITLFWNFKKSSSCLSVWCHILFSLWAISCGFLWFSFRFSSVLRRLNGDRQKSLFSTTKEEEDKEVKSESAKNQEEKRNIWIKQLQKQVIPSGSEVAVAVAPPPTKNTAMLDFDWLILGMPVFPTLWGPKVKWVWLLLMPLLLNSKSGSRAVSVETTHEAGRHFFRVYGVLTRRFIFSPEALRLPFSVWETSSKERRRKKNH